MMKEIFKLDKKSGDRLVLFDFEDQEPVLCLRKSEEGVLQSIVLNAQQARELAHALQAAVGRDDA